MKTRNLFYVVFRVLEIKVELVRLCEADSKSKSMTIAKKI